MQWKVFFAAATGKHHLDSGMPCQDAVHHRVIPGGFIGVVCDGAGSASHGHEGAAFVARAFAGLLAESAPVTAWSGDAAAGGHEQVLALLADLRGQLGDIARARDLALRDFACTLVACIVRDGSGCFFHVGDGFAIFVGEAGNCVLSLPENGEFADETYFVTGDHWADHLRITPLPRLAPGCLIGLMSDGTAPFAVNRSRTGFYPPFIDPVTAFLRPAAADVGNAALHGVLASEKTFAITGDDKTLLLALAG
jgi:hypothetical protein